MWNRLEDVLGYIGYQAWAVLMGAFWFYDRILQAGSPTLETATGMTAGMNNHGQWFFVHPWQKALFDGTFPVCFAVILIAGAAIQRFFGSQALQKLRPKTLTLAIVVAAIGWALVVRLV